MEWSKKTDRDYQALCYPKKDQNLYIHGEDVIAMKKVLKKYKPKVMLEIGSAYGTSTKLLAAIAEEFGGHVYCIEPDPKPEWEVNLKEHDLLKYTTMIKGESPWISWEGNPKIDFLFIDGFHNYRNTFTDYFYWQKYLKTGGVVAFHDTNRFPQVSRAVDEIIRSEDLHPIGTSSSKCGMRIFEKRKVNEGSVFFGPWVGEFGHEVAWWQGWCRREAKKYKHVIVSSYPSSIDMYEDFADELRPHELTGNPICGFANNLTGDFEYPIVEKVYAPPEKRFVPKKDQDFIKFGNDNPYHEYDIIFHSCEHKRKTVTFWDDLVTKYNGLKIASVGLKGRWPDQHIKGTDDLRDLRIRELSRHLAGAKVVVGPSSGMMHFASNCNANMVVWGDQRTYTWRQTIRQRYEDIINPFDNKVIILDKWEWKPPKKEVINAITKYI
jgi:hypothetical protein